MLFIIYVEFKITFMAHQSLHVWRRPGGHLYMYLWIHLHRPISYIQNQIYHVIYIRIYTYKTLMYRMHVCVRVCNRSFTREPLDVETLSRSRREWVECFVWIAT